MHHIVADLSSAWHYSFKETLGLIFVMGVVGAYATLFALTRRPALGWAITAAVAFLAMIALILISPEKALPSEEAIVIGGR